jgi:hypothetical protein
MRQFSIKRRLTISLIAGVLIPIVYGIILVPLGILLNYDPASFDQRFRIATMPIFFPVWLGDYSGILPADNFVGVISLVIIFGTDVIVYSSLVYCVLWFWSARQK